MFNLHKERSHLKLSKNILLYERCSSSNKLLQYSSKNAINLILYYITVNEWLFFRLDLCFVILVDNNSQDYTRVCIVSTLDAMVLNTYKTMPGPRNTI